MAVPGEVSREDAAEQRRLERSRYPVRKTTLQEQDELSGLEGTTSAERIGMMWQLALDAWAFTGTSDAEMPMRRDVVCIYRGGALKEPE